MSLSEIAPCVIQDNFEYTPDRKTARILFHNDHAMRVLLLDEDKEIWVCKMYIQNKEDLFSGDEIVLLLHPDWHKVKYLN